MNKGKKINISYVGLSDLKPAEYNPRKWDELSLEKLMESVKKFGFVDPVIINKAPRFRY